MEVGVCSCYKQRKWLWARNWRGEENKQAFILSWLLKVGIAERFERGRKKLSGGLGDAVVGWEFLLSQKKAKKAELTMKI